jgi:hypothetical protein
MNATAEVRWLASIRNDWLVLALCLVDQGGVAKSAGAYFDRGRPIPEHLTKVFDRLIWAGWVGVATGDPLWALREMNLTKAGQTRYALARHQHAGRHAGPGNSAEIPVDCPSSSGPLAGSEAGQEGQGR